ncbi:interleukin-23 subunit alpha [Pelobates cultripes]|uniref:Interleukin-23 subunit alpha n=1 Tax=Pelobates cultripes TaxID=61616 RepID=A0AAD1R6B9_PELCU|nr:interleukin-23 subunit alpha [Pelobates cultripes]
MPVVQTTLDTCSWEEFKNLSHDLNIFALEFQTFVNKSTINPSRSVPLIQCNDQCHPEGLAANKERCLKRIYEVLYYYEHYTLELFGEGSLHKNSHVSLKINQMESHLRSISNKVKPEVANAITNITKKIHSLRRCLEKNGYKGNNTEEKDHPPITKSSIEYISGRFISVTPLIARVFALGDPSRHMSYQKK